MTSDPVFILYEPTDRRFRPAFIVAAPVVHACSHSEHLTLESAERCAQEIKAKVAEGSRS